MLPFHISQPLGGLKMNIPTFLYVELDKVIEYMQKKRCEDLTHQGLIKIVFKHKIKKWV